MKKLLATLMLAAMVLSTGCGNTMDGAKKDAQEAAQKVEQKADEVKQDAANVKADVEQKVDEVKADAAQKADEVKADAAQKADEVKQDVADMKGAVAGREIAIGGVKLGVNPDAVKAVLGEPTFAGDDEFIFANGLEIELDNGVVTEIKSTRAGVKTAQGIEVGMMEYALNNFCGAADDVDIDDDGEVEYKYFGGDKKSNVVYTARNGLITEIKCSND